MDKDSLGDRMKMYEASASKRLMPLLPVMIRLDGVAFHTFTKGLNRPYDERLSRIMVETTKYLAKLTNARIAYTQSDEISLILQAEDYEQQIYFDGKISKLTSVLAAKASVHFNILVSVFLAEKRDQLPTFDCRVWNVPTREEAVNTIIWRELDAVRNSIQMTAQSLYSHNELQNKPCNELQEMIFQRGINWNDYPVFFKRGTYVQRKKQLRPFTVDEISQLPEKHEARINPELVVTRTDIEAVELPIMTKIVNRVDVIFDGASPIVKENE